MSPPDAATLRDRQLSDGSLFPAYEDWCFARIPGTVGSLLGADVAPRLPAAATEGYGDVSRVVVFLVDGFGLAQWTGERERVPFLRRFEGAGRVTPLTSVYPSETAAAMNTFHSGALPAEHGVVGWNVYDPAAGEQFEALPFLRKDGTEPDGLAADEVADAAPVYPALGDAGVDCHLVSPFPVTGAATHPYDPADLSTFPDAFAEAAAAAADPAYVFAYLPQTDAVAHDVGVASDGYRETAAETFERVAEAVRTLADAADGTAEGKETLVCVTADHGLVDTDPARNVDLSAPPFELVPALQTLADGTPVRFAGSPRNVHLHLRPGRVGEVVDALRSELDATVFRRAHVLESGLFGPDPSETFERRLGDVVVAPRELGVWWGDAEPDNLAMVGMHGGLHPDEMLVPFATATLDGLVAAGD